MISRLIVVVTDVSPLRVDVAVLQVRLSEDSRPVTDTVRPSEEPGATLFRKTRFEFV